MDELEWEGSRGSARRTDAWQEFVVVAMWHRDVNQEAKHLLLQTASAMVAFSAIRILDMVAPLSACGGDDDLVYILHHSVFYVTGIAGSALLFLSYSAHKFPPAARRASSMAAAVVRLRRQPPRVFASGLVLLRRDATSLSVFYCNVRCVAAFIYVLNPCSLCYNGTVWFALFFSI